MCGKIQVKWKKEDFILNVVIPTNSRADVILLVNDPGSMKIIGGQVERAGGLQEIKEEGKVILTLASGKYEIQCKPFYN